MAGSVVCPIYPARGARGYRLAAKKGAVIGYLWVLREGDRP